MVQLGGKAVIENTALGTPAPVIAHSRGGVHTGFMSKTQNVLRLHNGKLGGTGPDAAHHTPVIALLLGQVEILHGAGNVLRGGSFHPAVDRLVIVGTHIGDTVHGVAVGAVLAAVAAVKAKFQNLHAGVAAPAQ